jgi:outer membrane lipoprotein-sorting protein
MKKSVFTLFVLLSFSLGVIAQNENPKDPKAKKILDKVSVTNKSYATMYIEFNYRLENKPNGVDETQSGKVWIKGDRYKLIFPGIERYSDGKAVWTYLSDDDECQISDATSDDEDEGSISPSTLLTIYESGFNYLYGSEVTVNDKKTDMIKLFPEGGGKPYHTIKLYIDQATSQITRIEVFSKDGNTFTYDLKTVKSNEEMNDAMFVFDTSKAGDIVDLRD